MDNQKLREVLRKHGLWLLGEADGERANLCEADLRGADLREADLYEADLYGANLREADLYGANLREANLCEADLRGANLCEADLRGANLREADLYGANLREADLYEADLRGADLREADLYEADLREAGLYGAKVEDEIKAKFFPLVCPEEGSFIAWKTNGSFIIKLRVCEDAKRSSAYGRKCRCSKAEVLEIQEMNGDKADLTSVSSSYDSEFVYTVGEIVQVDNFDDDRWNECSTGIHFFITRQEAVDYDI